MTKYKNVLIGKNTFASDWKLSLNKINETNKILK